MNKTKYEQVNKTLYHEVLPNGPTVYLLPKNNYHKTYGLLSTNYSSVDNEFIPYGEKEKVRVSDGVAHFLEHKLFEKKDGDVFQLFGQQGASADAFTSFTKTSYLFSTANQVGENPTTLIDFMQASCFTEETVSKGKGVIGQEIQMYEDDPDWQIFFGILNNLYPTHPLRIDITGTVESINKTTTQDLHTYYRAFCQSGNMVLFVVGKVEPEKLTKLIREGQEEKSFSPKQEIVRYFLEDTKEIIKQSALEAAITRNEFILGIKGLDILPQGGAELLRYKAAINLLLQMVLGNTSRNYLIMYSQGIIDDSFGFEFNLDRELHFADLSGDTDEPEKAVEKIKEIILGFADNPEVSEMSLDLLEKRMLGQYFQSLDSIEYTTNQFTQSLFGDRTLFDLPEIIDSIQMKDVLAAGETFISEEASSEFYVRLR